jgi:putative spermidine/putrescine transport system substrate-binding protein
MIDDRWRRWARFVVVSAVSVLAAGCGLNSSDSENSARQVVIDSWGGVFQDAQTAVLYEPFEAESGTKVVQLSDAENMFAKVMAQAERDVGEIDLVHGDASWLTRGERSDLWAPIDPATYADTGLFEDAKASHGVGILYWSMNITYNRDKFPDGGPTSWPQVWDYAIAHPKRVALFGPRPNYVLEAALMAAGIAPADVYPLTDEKVDQAYASLDRVKDKVLWYEGGAQGERYFTEDQIDVAMYYGGEAYGLVDKGQRLEVVWNQGIYTRDYWMIPANAPNKEGALELLRFALGPDRQAEMARRTGNGPVTEASVAKLEPKFRARMASVEPQKSRQLSYDWQWWGANDDKQLARWTEWLRG